MARIAQTLLWCLESHELVAAAFPEEAMLDQS
jgi:hypothetical protein